ncbi:MAG: P-loop NTPase [Methanomassiliicoccus sp.]|nr:P-loop NTPase [Methanomassiliicoccus sp.]
MSLKIAVSGKGGVGKTTVAVVLASQLAREGRDVIAVDADPASSMPAALGIPEGERKTIVPLSQMLELIEERTGMRPGAGTGGLYSLNPQVDDLADRYAVRCADGIRLLVLGTIKAPGAGCFCPESALLKALLRHLVLDDQHVLVLDMEAGLEHLGRSTLQAVDLLLVVVEPGRRSVDTASRVAAMARELGVRQIYAVLNKVSAPQQEVELRRLLREASLECLAAIPFDERLVQADLSGRSVMESGARGVLDAVAVIKDEMLRR